MRIKIYLLIFLFIALSLCVIYAAEITPGLLSFNAGELSPLMKMRSDFGKYNNACAELENMLILSQGPIIRRPGTKYIADANESRLIPFEYSKTDAYILLFEDCNLFFFRETD